MKHHATRTPRATRAAFAFVLAATLGGAYALPLAQAPKWLSEGVAYLDKDLKK